MKVLGFGQFENENNIENEVLFCINCQGKMYLAIKENAMLLSKEITANEWHFETLLPNEFEEQNGECCRVFSDNDKIYIYSTYLDILVQYKVDTKELKTVRLNIFGIAENNTNGYGVVIGKISKILKYGEKIIVVPWAESAIGIYDLNIDSITYHIKWKEQLKEVLKKDENIYIRNHSACIVADKIYMIVACEKKDVICCISLDDMELSGVYDIANRERLFYMEPGEEGIWMQCFDEEVNSLMLWNEANGVVKEIAIPKVNDRNPNGFMIILQKERLYAIPMNQKKAFCFSSNDGNLIKSKDWEPYAYIGNIEEDFYYVDSREEKIIVYDYNFEKVQQITVNMKKDFKKEAFMSALENDESVRDRIFGSIIYENGNMQLRDFFHVL